MTKAPVLPVPFLALAMTLLPETLTNFSNFTGKSNGKTLFLDWRWFFESFFDETHHELLLFDKGFEIISLGVGDILYSQNLVRILTEVLTRVSLGGALTLFFQSSSCSGV